MLQNHVLFLLAEQPPAAMAALLGTFKSPLVKRRMEELLSTIKDAVKRGMRVAQLDNQGAEEQKEPESAKKDVVMLDAEMKALAEKRGVRQQQQEATGTVTKNFRGQNGTSSGTTNLRRLGHLSRRWHRLGDFRNFKEHIVWEIKFRQASIVVVLA
jgi:exosome complex exonuclease RRP6